MIIKRWVARRLYRMIPACFACGRPGEQPCPGHEYGGVIGAYRRRRWAPWWLADLVDPRDGWRAPRPLVRDHWYRPASDRPGAPCGFAGCARLDEVHLRWVGEWRLPRWRRWYLMASRRARAAWS